MTAFARQI